MTVLLAAMEVTEELAAAVEVAAQGRQAALAAAEAPASS